MRSDRAILGLAVVLLLLTLRCPARAVDGLNQLDLGGAGLTTTDVMIAVCDAETVITYDRGATSPTDAGRLIAHSGGEWSVSNFSVPTPTNGYGQARSLGCIGGTVVVGGGESSSAGSWWVYSASTADLTSWTTQVDTAGGAGEYGSYAGLVGDDPGANAFTLVFQYHAPDGNDYIQVYSADLSPFSLAAGFADYNPGTNKFSNECSGIEYMSTRYAASCVGDATYAVGYDGSTTEPWTSAAGACPSLGAGGTKVMRQAFAGGDTATFVAYNGTNSMACGFAGSAGNRFVNQSFSSISMVSGAYFTFPSASANHYLWSAGGTAYVGGGGSTSTYFSDDTGTDHDLPCDSGVLSVVVTGVDVDQDADATDNLLGICTSGDAVYFGEALPESGGLSPIIILDDEPEFP